MIVMYQHICYQPVLRDGKNANAGFNRLTAFLVANCLASLGNCRIDRIDGESARGRCALTVADYVATGSRAAARARCRGLAERRATKSAWGSANRKRRLESTAALGSAGSHLAFGG